MKLDRLRQLRQYKPWILPVLDRLGVYPKDLPVAVVVEGQSRSFRVCIESGKSDFGRINEVLLDAPYLRYFQDRQRDARPLIVVDVGANKGLFALSAADHGEIRGYCFEPIESNVAYLRANIELNGLDVEVCTSAVVPDGRRNVRMNIASSPGQHSVLSEDELSVATDAPPRLTGAVDIVQARNLNDELKRIIESEGRIDLLKLDVEGLELALLRSVEDDVWAELTYVVAEVWERQSSSPAFSEMVSRLSNLGFDVNVIGTYVYISAL